MLIRFLTSRLGLAAIILAGMWGWHVYDKRQALAHARDGYVAAFELAAAKAEIEAITQRAERVAAANKSLMTGIELAHAEADRFAAELEAYERETEINSDCRVDPDLVQRLRAN